MFNAFFAFISIIVWGGAESANDGDTVIWGTDAGRDGDNIVWGT